MRSNTQDGDAAESASPEAGLDGSSTANADAPAEAAGDVSAEAASRVSSDVRRHRARRRLTWRRSVGCSTDRRPVGRIAIRIAVHPAAHPAVQWAGIAAAQLVGLAALVARSLVRPQSTGRHSGFRIRRGTAYGTVLLAATIAGGIAIGVTVLVRPADQPSITVADPIARQQAADRADRASRGSTGLVDPTATAAPAPGASASVPTSATPAPAAAATAPPVAKPSWVDPMPGAAITSCFGLRWGSEHQGIDFALAQGATIRAAAAGTVLGAGWLYAGYGMSVMIDNGGGLYTHYAHAEQLLVSTGQKVVAGQPIALEGATGDVTGPHLHFEVHLGLWNQIDPAPFLRARGVAVNAC